MTTSCVIALGSNLGSRREHLERALRALAEVAEGGVLRIAPVFESPALTPPGAPPSWARRFLNTAVELQWSSSAADLLACLKRIEAEGGREPGPRWAPRPIDLDIIAFGDDVIERPDLRIPHPEATKRGFVLAPLKHLRPSWRPPGWTDDILSRARQLPALPVWMGVVNLTPDSFSDGGEASFALQTADEENIQILDFGAESTRPGAKPLDAETEWRRLEPALAAAREHYGERHLRPLISVDTRHAGTAERALRAGVDMINDVSGFTDPGLLPVLLESSCQYVLMHSLSVPADRARTLPEDTDPVAAVKEWAVRRIELLQNSGLDPARVIFDPGIGFGKTAEQSLTLLRRIEEFLDLPVRLLIGHSRKSFMEAWGSRPASERDPESVGASLALAARGADILRVHAPHIHARAWRAHQEVQA